MLNLKPNQQKVIDVINLEPIVDEIVLIGSVGTGKTVVAAHIVASICYNFPDTAWYAWRKNNTVSRRTLIKTFRETLSNMGLIENEDWTWHDRDLEIRFSSNKSIISFSEADRSKDRDQMRIKGVDATGNLIDESNELEEDSFDMILSRKGRKNKNGQPSINIITMNPNNGWAKRRYYDKWKKGVLPPNVKVIQFSITDSWQSKQDIEGLYRKAKWWVERYIKNNWNYADEDMSLITSYLWDKSQVHVMPSAVDDNGAVKEFDKYLGVDVSDVGSDSTVVTLIESGVVTEQKELKIPERVFGEDKEVDERSISTLYTNELIKFAQRHGFSAKYAKRICVEGNGIGAGLRDRLRDRGWYITVYQATSQTRNENYLSLREDMENSDLKIFYEDIEKYDDNTLQKQLFAHTVDVINEKEVVLPKKFVKKELGLSPDKADSLMIANYVKRLYEGKIKKESSMNQSRIRF